MSFILDALKKAESERNRHVAPVLMDARIAPPRRGLPPWAWALGAVMLVNLGLIGWLLLRTPAAPAVATAATAPDPGGAAQAAPAGVATAPAAAAPVASTPSASPPPQSTAAPVSPSIATMPSGAAASPTLVGPDSRRIEDDFALPTVPELRAAGVSLPELQLNLHVYDPAPAYRSVLLNGNRLSEGEYTPDGVKVERITPQAVVLEAGGRRFRLDAGG